MRKNLDILRQIYSCTIQTLLNQVDSNTLPTPAADKTEFAFERIESASVASILGISWLRNPPCHHPRGANRTGCPLWYASTGDIICGRKILTTVKGPTAFFP